MKRKKQGKIIWTGFIIRIMMLFFICLIGYFFVLILNTNRSLDKSIISKRKLVSDEHSTQSKSGTGQKIFSLNDSPSLKGGGNNRLNILVLGMDGGTRKSGTFLTDTIALVSINPKTYQSAILSIPRDLYVKIPNTNYHTKINALYTYGLKNQNKNIADSADLIRQSVEEITGQTVPYYIIIDFDGFKEIINTLGGIDVNVLEDIKDTRYPGPNYSYETFEIKKGLQHLDADTALKYARVRHTKGGDFGRAERQQQVTAAVRKKALDLKIITNPLKIKKILNTLGKHFKTNIQKNELLQFAKIIKNTNPHQTTTVVLDAWDKDSLLKSTHIPLGGAYAYVLVPRIKSYAQIQTLASNIFDLKKIQEAKAKRKEEDAYIQLATENNHLSNLFQTTLQHWDYLNVKQASYQLTKQCPKNKDAIISYSAKNKLFTLNSLAENLNIPITYKNNLETSQTDKNTYSKYPDILLCITKATITFFQDTKKMNNSAKSSSSPSQAIINPEGKVLFN